jgi:hypothetical protein
MARQDHSSSRDPEKEEYWREKLRNWRSSGLSQADFCRKEGLNQNSFSSWKKIIAKRDIEQAPRAKEVGDRAKQQRLAASPKLAKKPMFVKLGFDSHAEADGGGNLVAAKADREGLPDGQLLAAELLDPRSGLRVRVFNGADRSTLSALVASLAGLQSIEF